MNTQSNIDIRRPFFISLAKGLVMTSEGRAKLEAGKARTIVSLVSMAAMLAAQEDKADYTNLVLACRQIHADPTKSRVDYASGWAFFRNNLGDVLTDAKIKSEEDVSLVKKTKADNKDTDTYDIRSYNRLEGTRESALKTAASIVYWFHACGVSWSATAEDGTVHLLVTASKSGEQIRVQEPTNMNRLYAKKEDSVKRAFKEHDYVNIGNHMTFTFTALEESGNAKLIKDGFKKQPATRDTTKINALRDALTTVADESNTHGLLNDTSGAFDKPADENVILKTFIATANWLNDPTLKNVKADNVDYSIMTWLYEGMVALSKGQDVPPTYKALHDFASKYLDKNVAKDNGQPKKAAA